MYEIYFFPAFFLKTFGPFVTNPITDAINNGGFVNNDHVEAPLVHPAADS